MQLEFIRPEKPVENAFIESFNGRLRDELLNGELFMGLLDARAGMRPRIPPPSRDRMVMNLRPRALRSVRRL
jgi:hypothetical protein